MEKLGNIVRKLPIGIQSFDKLRTENYLYVHKTEFIYQMAYQGVPYFLSRPQHSEKLAAMFLELISRKKKITFRGLAMKLETEGDIRYFISASTPSCTIAARHWRICWNAS